MEPFTVKFTDPNGKTWTTTVVAPDIGTAKTIVQEMYPYATVEG